GKDGGEISGETRQASLADLEDISCQSCESDCGRRFFHNPDDQFPRFVLLHRPSSRSQEAVTAPHSPFQNPYAERVIGSIRRECLDHLIVLNEEHLCRILRDYFRYYHESRPHQSLERNSPTPREIEPPSKGKVIALPQVSGLHHRYHRAA